MPRRPDPTGIHAARRAGTVHRMVADGLSLDVAEAWADHWEATTTSSREDDRYWDEAFAWIAEQRAGRRGSGG